MKGVIDCSLFVRGVVLSVGFDRTDVNVSLRCWCVSIFVSAVCGGGDGGLCEDTCSFGWDDVAGLEFSDVSLCGVSVREPCCW